MILFVDMDMHDHPEEPWFFHRDELTLIEEGFEDLFTRHDVTPPGARHAMEEQVLQEHLATEERFEKELADMLGPDLLSDAMDHAGGMFRSAEAEESGFGTPESEPVPDPLFRKAMVWARELVAWSSVAYVRNPTPLRDLYRVLVNAHLVPIKLSFYAAELVGEDHVSQQVAKKELELTNTYLQRAMGSLRALALGGVLPEAHEGAVLRGTSIEEEVARRLALYNQSSQPPL